MAKSTKPNFSLAYSKANEVLATSNTITGFPFSTKALVREKSNIHFCTYQKAHKKFGLDVTALGSESAIIIQRGERTIIFYDNAKPQSHIDFSILHEWGHSVNGHDLRVKDHDLYRKYEVETNYFAAQLLMPEQLLRELQKRGVRITTAFLQTYFCVSRQAAEKRIEALSKINVDWRRSSEHMYDDIILCKYANFLNQIQPTCSFCDLQSEYDLQEKRYSWC